MAHPAKAGVAKLKAYVIEAQRASAGEAHGDIGWCPIEALHGLQGDDRVA